jgi:hypothetical protein
LKILNLSYCYKITDQAFSLAPIQAPLEEINLNFIRQVTNKTLESLLKVSSTLKKLLLKSCSEINADGLKALLLQTSCLNYIDVRDNSQYDNAFLEFLLHPNKFASKIKEFVNIQNINF